MERANLANFSYPTFLEDTVGKKIFRFILGEYNPVRCVDWSLQPYAQTRWARITLTHEVISHPTAIHRVGSFIHEILTEVFMTGGLALYDKYFDAFSGVVECTALANIALNDPVSFQIA